MAELHTALYDAAGVRALDQLVIESHGVPGYELMCRAGAFCFARLLARWPDCQRAVLVCGTGNNGGDGFVIARLMVEAGLEPRVFVVGDVHNVAGDARTALDAMRDAGVEEVTYILDSWREQGQPYIFDDCPQGHGGYCLHAEPGHFVIEFYADW